jgi:hypothetical protein
MRNAMLLAAVGLTAVAWAAEDAAIEPGPERDGLRLRLIVKSNVEKIDHHIIALEFLNVSDKPISFESGYAFRGAEEESAFIKMATVFHVFPDVLPRPFGSKNGFVRRGGERPKTVLITVEPHESHAVQWSVTGRTLDHFKAWSEVEFPTTGRFDLRAQVTLCMSDQREVMLCSNTQPLDVGGSKKAPKACTATVSFGDAAEHLVWLDGVGPFNGVRNGDRFRIALKWGGHFLLEVTDSPKDWAHVEHGVAARVVESVFSDAREPEPKFPQAGMKASLEPEATQQKEQKEPPVHLNLDATGDPP